MSGQIFSGTGHVREFKDRLFKAIYGRDTPESKKWRLELYNALNGSCYTNPDDIELTTIENVIYITMKNDVSFLIGDEMNLFEQQSSYNPNLPLRGLMYFAQLYQIWLTKKGLDLFGSKLVKIPAPRFIVFYIGNTECPDIVKNEAFGLISLSRVDVQHCSRPFKLVFIILVSRTEK